MLKSPTPTRRRHCGSRGGQGAQASIHAFQKRVLGLLFHRSGLPRMHIHAGDGDRAGLGVEVHFDPTALTVDRLLSKRVSNRQRLPGSEDRHAGTTLLRCFGQRHVPRGQRGIGQGLFDLCSGCPHLLQTQRVRASAREPLQATAASRRTDSIDIRRHDPKPHPRAAHHLLISRVSAGCRRTLGRGRPIDLGCHAQRLELRSSGRVLRATRREERRVNDEQVRDLDAIDTTGSGHWSWDPIRHGRPTCGS